MRPSPRSTRSKKPSTSASPRRRPRVGDVVDVFWDDRQVYYRGRLVKRYYPHKFGFYIRYDDGDYISTDLNCFMWHYATDSSVFMPSCCEMPQDFQEGQLEELWGRGSEAGERRSRAANLVQSETTANEPGRADEAQEEGMQDGGIGSAALHEDEGEISDGHDAGNVDPLGKEEEVAAGVMEEKVVEVSDKGDRDGTDDQGESGETEDICEAVRGGHDGEKREDVPCVEGEGEMTGELVRMRSAMSASGETVGEGDAERTGCKEDMGGVGRGGQGRGWDRVRVRKKSGTKRGVRSAGEDSPTASCQSLTTAEGFCLLDDLRRAKRRMRTSKKRALEGGEGDLGRNGSEAGVSLEEHWKRRLRRRYFGEMQE